MSREISSDSDMQFLFNQNRASNTRYIIAEQRKKVRELTRRILEDDTPPLSESELLEFLLRVNRSYISPSVLAVALLQRFGSYSAVLAASIDDLILVDGISFNVAVFLKGIHAGSVKLFRERPFNRPYFSSIEFLRKYLMVGLFEKNVKCLAGLFLDRRKNLSDQEFWGNGTADRLVVNPREIIEMAFKSDASYTILATNGLGVEGLPLEADIRFAISIGNALRKMEIDLIDFYIIENGTCLSLKEIGALRLDPIARGIENTLR